MQLNHVDFRHTKIYKYNIELKQCLNDNNNLPNELINLGLIIYDYAKTYILPCNDIYYPANIEDHLYILNQREKMRRENY